MVYILRLRYTNTLTLELTFPHLRTLCLIIHKIVLINDHGNFKVHNHHNYSMYNYFIFACYERRMQIVTMLLLPCSLLGLVSTPQWWIYRFIIPILIQHLRRTCMYTMQQWSSSILNVLVLKIPSSQRRLISIDRKCVRWSEISTPNRKFSLEQPS